MRDSDYENLYFKHIFIRNSRILPSMCGSGNISSSVPFQTHYFLDKVNNTSPLPYLIIYNSLPRRDNLVTFTFRFEHIG